MSEENKNLTEETKAVPQKQGAPTGVIILLLILFFPVGIILMWLKKSWKLWVKIVISALFFVIIVAAAGGNSDAPGSSGGTTPSGVTSSGITADAQKEKEPSVTYEKVDLQKMLDDLDENALRAEKTYQNKYVEVTGKIRNFDSDGSYISIEPVGSKWTLTSVMCYIKSSEQRDYLLNKNVGDSVTIKGKIKSIGEVLGYSINIDEVE